MYTLIASRVVQIGYRVSTKQIHCQVCQSRFDEREMLLCDICNAIWHMDCHMAYGLRYTCHKEAFYAIWHMDCGTYVTKRSPYAMWHMD